MMAPIFVEASEVVGIKKFCELVGTYSVTAVRKKIERGIWVVGQVLIKAPDGHVFISLKGFYKWAEGKAGAG